MPQIWSLRKGAPTPPPDAVRVDRRTPWGNPVEMRRESERDAACDEFDYYATEKAAREPDWLTPLRGKSLVCWCQSPGDRTPKRCHAETLLRLTNDGERGEGRE